MNEVEGERGRGGETERGRVREGERHREGEMQKGRARERGREGERKKEGERVHDFLVQALLCLAWSPLTPSEVSPAATMAAANIQVPDVNAMVAAGDTSASKIENLDAELKALQTTKKNKAKELKLEKSKRARLMKKVSSGLSMEELGQVMAMKVAQAKAKAKAKATKAQALAAAAALPPVLPPPVPVVAAAGAVDEAAAEEERD